MGHKHIVEGLIAPLGLKGVVRNEAGRSLGKILAAHVSTLCRGRNNVELHHYTNASGLIGMLASRPMTMWASLATHLNDSAELHHGQEIVWREFQRYRKALKELGVRWEEILRPDDAWTNIYVACFTEKEDSLGQWRGYSGKRGYALTLQLGSLPTDVLLAKVNYADDVLALRATAEGLVDLYRSFRGKVKPAAIVKSLKRGLALAASLYKGRRWREEQEWRLVQWCETAGHNGFRESNGRLIPYHRTDLPRDLQLKAITVGPGYEFKIEKSAIDLLLKRRGWHGVDVRDSDVTLRLF